MPASVHKILIHGADVISVSLPPIGMLSEEAQEARNKDFRKFREYHARKTSRSETNRDVFHWMILSSDPLLSAMRKPLANKSKELPKEVLQLLTD